MHVLGNRSRGYYGEVNDKVYTCACTGEQITWLLCEVNGEVYMSTCAIGNRLRGHYGEVNGEVYTCACTGEQITWSLW